MSNGNQDVAEASDPGSCLPLKLQPVPRGPGLRCTGQVESPDGTTGRARGGTALRVLTAGVPGAGCCDRAAPVSCTEYLFSDETFVGGHSGSLERIRMFHY